MEEPLKARLIGAAVLVALAVLLIPELLSGRKTAEPVAEEGAGPRGTRTFTIELGQGPGQAKRTAATAPAPAPAPAAAVGATPPAAGDAAVPQPIAAPGEPPAGAPAQEPVEMPAPSPEPARAAGVPKTTPTTVEAPPPVVSAEPQPPPALAAPGAGWAVQVGAFGSAETARKLVKDLGGAGYRAFVSPVTKGGKTLYRVRVGPEADRGGAEQLVPRLKARGLPATVVQND